MQNIEDKTTVPSVHWIKKDGWTGLFGALKHNGGETHIEYGAFQGVHCQVEGVSREANVFDDVTVLTWCKMFTWIAGAGAFSEVEVVWKQSS